MGKCWLDPVGVWSAFELGIVSARFGRDMFGPVWFVRVRAGVCGWVWEALFDKQDPNQPSWFLKEEVDGDGRRRDD